jgi:type IV pilus assembly protein PilM
VIPLAKYLISLDLGSQNIQIIYGRYNKGNIEIRNAVTAPIPEEVYKDGRIEDLDMMKQSIRDLITANKIKEKRTALTIQSTSIITRDIMLPATERQHLDNMVKYEIEQYLPIVATEYIIDYSVLDEIDEDGIRKYRIHVAAIPKNMVEQYLSLVKGIGLKPIALDILSNAAAKLFSQNASINGEDLDISKTLAYIDFGYRSISIHILSKRKLEFSRMINLGAREMDEEISITCNLSLSQAEKKKIQEADLNPEDYNELMADSFHDIIRSQTDIWLAEIQKVFQYYISRTTGNHIEGIYLYGGGSRLKGLDKYVEQALNLRTRNIDNLAIIKTAVSTSYFNPRDYINALGALIRYE